MTQQRREGGSSFIWHFSFYVCIYKDCFLFLQDFQSTSVAEVIEFSSKILLQVFSKEDKNGK